MVSEMKILMSGASGLVGSALVPALAADGHEVLRLVRRPAAAAGEVCWSPDEGEIDRGALAGTEAAVHLAGEPIAGRWTARKKERILKSRTASTRFLAETLAALEPPPRVWVTASAIGYYGDRGDEVLAEDAAPGTGFLPDVCVRWEQAAEAARARGVRHVPLRIGMVLSAGGGALARMLPPFRLGLGGPVGSGRQWVSWIAIDDLVGAVRHVLGDEEISGPVNAVAPEPVTMAELARTLGRALRRPAVLPLPAFAVRLLFGEMGDALLLASARVEPRRLAASGYGFRLPELAPALAHLVG